MLDRSDKSDKSDIKPPPHSGCHTAAGIPHVLYSRSCLITRGGGARNKTYKTYKTYEQAVRRAFFAVWVLTVRFLPARLILAAQMSDRSDKSDRSDIKPQPRLCRSHHSGYTAWAVRSSGLTARCLESSYTLPITQRKFCIAGHA